jgi:putative glycosyltransferase (TIGR04372 family)
VQESGAWLGVGKEAGIKHHIRRKIRKTSLEPIPKKEFANFHQFDHLLYSFEDSKHIRFESGADLSTYQVSPEWRIAYSNPLKLSEQDQKKGEELFRHVIGDQWFIALHIRGPESILDGSQARDALIEDYREMCEYVRSLGGIVIRMGDSRFAPINEKFPAFDYANSHLRSEFLDCWLWANCQFWVGNPNGAALTSLIFGKKRLITNQWYWNARGTSDDYILPKLLSDKKKVLNIKETFESGVSRQMNRNLIHKEGFLLIENSPEDILDGFKDMISKKRIEISDLDKEFRHNLGFHDSEQDLMHLAPSFVRKWKDL